MSDITAGSGDYGNGRCSWPKRLFQPWRLAIFAGLLTLLLIGWICFLLRLDSRGPVYNGKPLTLWLETYTSSARGSREWKEADEAAAVHVTHNSHALDGWLSPLMLFVGRSSECSTAILEDEQ